MHDVYISPHIKADISLTGYIPTLIDVVLCGAEWVHIEGPLLLKIYDL